MPDRLFHGSKQTTRRAIIESGQLLYRSVGCLFLSLGVTAANASPSCDELASRLFSKPIRQSLNELGCAQLGKVGLDKPDHKLQSVCYASTAKSSSLEVVVKLSCSTSDDATIKSSLSETITATAHVDASDCRVTDVSIAAPGEFSKLLLAYLDAGGKAREALQKQLDSACSP